MSPDNRSMHILAPNRIPAAMLHVRPSNGTEDHDDFPRDHIARPAEGAGVEDPHRKTSDLRRHHLGCRRWRRRVRALMGRHERPLVPRPRRRRPSNPRIQRQPPSGSSVPGERPPIRRQSERRIPERCFSLSPDANLNGEQNQLTQHQRDLSHDRKGKEVNQALQVLNFT